MKKEDGFPGQISIVLPDKIIGLIKGNPLISDLYLTDIARKLVTTLGSAPKVVFNLF